jgi:hypothetical protein
MKNGSFEKQRWVVLQKGEVAAQWAGIYVSLNREGAITIGHKTHERLGSPEAYLIKLDPLNDILALEPAAKDARNAYPARIKGYNGGKVLRAHRLLTDFGIRLDDTVEFTKAKIDLDGTLILSMRDIRISPRAHSQCRKKGS